MINPTLSKAEAMANRWNIPKDMEAAIRQRDVACVYCRIPFGLPSDSRRSKATWEHIVNDARLVTEANIARCCAGCNSSKGAKTLSDWLSSPYCASTGISAQTVAPVVRAHLVSPR